MIILLIFIVIFVIIILVILHNDKITPYRLGDMFTFPGYFNKDIKLHRIMGEFYHHTIYPNSIASKYMKRTKEPNDYNILLDIINKELAKNKIKLPTDDTIIIHIRIGDIMEYEIYNNDTRYIKPLSYYKEKLEKYEKYGRMKNVVIVAGSHIKLKLNKSLIYLTELQKMIEKMGYNVVVRLNNLPDDDFLYMTSAKYFIASGGGFSNIIKNVVKMRRGVTE